MTGPDETRIERWSDIQVEARAALQPGLDGIFFEASATKAFPDEPTRLAFRQRWLGRYLELDPVWAYVAIAPSGEPIGYLVGCLEDPARAPRFADIGYFASLAAVTARFPAHLHINLAPQARSHGLGGRLIARFAREAAAAGARGMHVVTARGMRNVGFYLRNGFHEAAAFDWNGKTLVLLARGLDG